MIFERFKTIRFQHCDSAGIIFYPQYFVLFHEVMEDWFTDGLDTPYGDYIRHQRLGVPAVKARADFLTQAFLGERLSCRLSCTRLGSSSLDYQVEVWHGNELRARGFMTVVQMSLETRRAVPFAAALRARIETFISTEPIGA
jgi:4-hydroxybenzoyl-CoA thioesterase